MDVPHDPLFRREVFEHRAGRLHGDVNLAVPVSWQLIGFALFLAVLVSLLFLGLASYSRVEVVNGEIVLDRGVASVVSTRPGVVVALHASEGQKVRAGARLVEIRSEEALTGGGTGPRRVMEALELQDFTLAGQSSMMMRAANAQRLRLTEQIAGLNSEIRSIDDQLASQRRLVGMAENEYRSVTGVAERGFISRRDLRVREEAFEARRQQLLELEQARSAKGSQLAEAHRSVTEAGASAQAQAAGVASTRLELAQRLADVEATRGYTLTSPISGTVTAVTSRIGQSVSQPSALMVIVPNNARPRAELYVPTSAAGFLRVGQEMRLAVDAFPYQRYGAVGARILEISSVAIPRTGPDGRAAPVYLLTAELARPWVLAFGREQPLLPGMTLNARIVTEKQSLFRWLFEPLFAVSKR